jgi:hypothetical protein
MLRSVPWDVWAAEAIAVAVALVAIFDPAPAVFIAIYLGLCASATPRPATSMAAFGPR